MMDIEKINSQEDAAIFVEGCVNDLVEGISTKEETLGLLGAYTARLMQLFWENSKKKIRENPELLNEKI